MLICGILFFRLQSSCLTKFHGPLIFHLKRFIVKDRCWFSIVVVNNIFWASRKRLKPDRGDDERSSSQKWRISSESYSSEDYATSKRMGSDDMNEDVCIISTSGFSSGRGFVKRFSEKVYITPSTMGGGLHNPPTYKTVYITSWTFQNRSNYILKQFWKIIVNHRKIIK